ncbi:Oidioi.mRNA.OKI2018_I69.chr2.g4034.t1.cds [Oikopleura dioica]|uniref:Oidioi.mRNA.OKI2018_I69.chr2.g4034.t1.cds n=1 Tax=Oikopleura dioica TaxID=34765 RepID=A0ABN7SVW8_OIKDI|nr:Oidioi.mRNA.OKI2018_I69.chr2.g4034.t1.cds [Oikopleura dioica]
MGSLPDGEILAESRTNPNYINKTFEIIQSYVLGKEWLNKVHKDRIKELVRLLMLGHRKASSLSDLLSHPVAREFLSERDFRRLNSRVEMELTPAEPDVDMDLGGKNDDRSKSKIREQFNEVVSPRELHNIVDKIKKTQHAWPNQLANQKRNAVRDQAFFYKEEQLVALNQFEAALNLVEYLQRFLKENKEPYFTEQSLKIEQTRILMIKYCFERKPAREIESGMIKKIQRTISDIIQLQSGSNREKMIEPGEDWLQLGIAILLDETSSCRFDKYKDPLLAFAQKLWNMTNRSGRAERDHRGGIYRTNEARIVWLELCSSLLDGKNDTTDYRRAVKPSNIVTLSKYLYNRELIEIMLTFILHLKRLHSGSSIGYAVLAPVEKLPRDLPKHIPNPVANVMAIEDSVDLLLETGMEYDKLDPTREGKFFVIKAEVLLQTGKPKEALALLLDFLARSCHRMTGVHPISESKPKYTTYCPIKFSEFLQKRCSKILLKLIGECLERISHFTSAAIAFFYADEHSKALQLVNHSERWDGMIEWYDCVWSIDLLEFLR